MNRTKNTNKSLLACSAPAHPMRLIHACIIPWYETYESNELSFSYLVASTDLFCQEQGIRNREWCFQINRMIRCLSNQFTVSSSNNKPFKCDFAKFTTKRTFVLINVNGVIESFEWNSIRSRR